MRGNIVGVLFTILSGVLIFLIVVAYGRSDRIAPEFRFAATDITYDSKTTDNQLKTGIAAYDAKDGDLTARIVVEKVVLNREKETAVVYYAVADYSGNVTKQSRVFPADIRDIDNNGDSSDTMEDEIFPGLFMQQDAALEGQSTESSEGSSGEGETNNNTSGN